MAFYKSTHRIEKERRIAAWTQLRDEAFEKLSCTHEDIAELERCVHGQIVLPDDATYNASRQQSNPAFQKYPCIIVYCETAGDVKCCLRFAYKFNLWVACRSGGHSTAGYSVNDGGMVIDTSRIQYVHVDRDAKLAHVGAGSSWGFVYAVVDSFGRHIPGGGCESVHIAGYMQGGGYSFTSREFGMNCDNVHEVKVMLADGRIVVANEEQNYPLYWAIRGGTGNNFVVLLEVTYALHDPGQFWGFSILWEIDDAPAALFEMQNNYMKTGASPKLGFQTIGTSQGPPQNKRQVLLMRGMYNGTEEEGREAIRSVLQTPGAQLQYGFSGSYNELNSYLLEQPEPIPSLPTGAKEDKQSGYIRAPLSLVEWQGVIAFFKTSPNLYSTFDLEAYGGAINAYPLGGNAFIHRDAYCDFFLDVFWVQDDERARVVQYLDDFMAMMQPYFDRPDGRPQANQDYPRATQTNYLELYFDGFIRDIITVKRLYDPNNFFHYQQSIPLEYPPDVEINPASPGFTGEEEIVYESYSSSIAEAAA